MEKTEKTGQKYIQVFIEGKEENLPEKSGEYYSLLNGTIALRQFNKKGEIFSEKYWIKCDWYFNPLPETKRLTDEEIKDYFTKEHYHYQKGRYTRVDKDRIYGAKWYRDLVSPLSDARDKIIEKQDEYITKLKDVFRGVHQAFFPQINIDNHTDMMRGFESELSALREKK